MANGKSQTAPAPPVRQYSFAGFQTSNPTTPPPGDKLDSEYTRTNKAISDIIAWVGTSLNNDGSLRADAAPAPTLVDTGDAAQALLYANLSGAWAEHMPDTIPPDVLAAVAVTGDHWSARWWANRAAQIVQNLSYGLPVLGDVTGSVTLPAGSQGDVYVRNNTGAPITIGLPPNPFGQRLMFKDCLGNAGTYPITIAAAPATIDGNPSYVLRSAYASLEAFWMGDQWGTR